MNKSDFSDYPFLLQLHFKSEEDRDEFLGGFLDGWGENAPIQTHWSWYETPIMQMAIDLEGEDDDG